MVFAAITGESLLALEKSAAVQEFEGIVAVRSNSLIERELLPRDIERRVWLPKRVVAIDASTLTHRVRNGFPGAEASLLMLSVVFIDITGLAGIKTDEIPSPRIFNEMESAHTLDAVLPGANVVRGGVDGDTPKDYFRKASYETFLGHLDPNHETLLETLRAITPSAPANISCPIDGCDNSFTPGQGEFSCRCSKAATLFETDSLRFHESFAETGSNGEVHGEVRHVLEVLSLVNILRFFERRNELFYLKDFAFVLDGPLAVFGQPARIAPFVRDEIIRISKLLRDQVGADLLVMGLEKSGQYSAHFSDLDWSDQHGPKGRYPAGTVLIPDARYINLNIVRRPEASKPSGQDTYFGRKIFYKNRNGSHNTINLAMTNDQAADFHNVSVEAFPRLGDALNILDHLSTYLHDGGFIPLIRAHAHSAIPLRHGAEILASMFPPSRGGG